MAQGLGAAVEVLRCLSGCEVYAGFPVQWNQAGLIGICLHLALLRVVEDGCNVEAGNVPGQTGKFPVPLSEGRRGQAGNQRFVRALGSNPLNMLLALFLPGLIGVTPPLR